MAAMILEAVSFSCPEASISFYRKAPLDLHATIEPWPQNRTIVHMPVLAARLFTMFADAMITVDLTTFKQGGAGGSVTGVIYLQLHGEALPAKGWLDFRVIILRWWIEALLQLQVPTQLTQK